MLNVILSYPEFLVNTNQKQFLDIVNKFLKQNKKDFEKFKEGVK